MRIIFPYLRLQRYFLWFFDFYHQSFRHFTAYDPMKTLPSGRYEIHNIRFPGSAAYLRELASPSDVVGRELGLNTQGCEEGGAQWEVSHDEYTVKQTS